MKATGIVRRIDDLGRVSKLEHQKRKPVLILSTGLFLITI